MVDGRESESIGIDCVKCIEAGLALVEILDCVCVQLSKSRVQECLSLRRHKQVKANHFLYRIM